ncbi:hypothetical protein ACQKKX_02320 [Neorhizobium sp. NPDC001467]|uniref:hypothetical protein n=1 Tax=Neorhizobium sp. NPDC001467 TaxID=3390595 RepID=UPI003D04A7E5
MSKAGWISIGLIAFVVHLASSAVALVSAFDLVPTAIAAVSFGVVQLVIARAPA